MDDPPLDEPGRPEAAPLGDAEGVGIVVRRATGPRRRRPHLDPVAAAHPRVIARRALMRPAEAEGLDPDRRFRVALAAQSAGFATAADSPAAGLARQLATAPILGMGRVVYSSNAVFVIELDAPDPADGGRLRAVYKPARGERPLWDFPHRTLHFREVAAGAVDAALGFDLVPATVLRDGPHGPGSVQRFVDVGDGRLDSAQREALSSGLLEMAVLDVLINNADRKSAHLLVDRRGRLRGIDHGLSFLAYPRQRTVLLELGGGVIPEAAAAALSGLDADLQRRTTLLQELGRLLAPIEVEAFSARLAELAADPTYPELDPWDGRPFEWW